MTTSTIEYRRRLGNKLRTAREAQGISQAELARRAGDWRQATLSLYETGRRDIPHFVFQTYARILGLSLCELDTFTPPTAPDARVETHVPATSGARSHGHGA